MIGLMNVPQNHDQDLLYEIPASRGHAVKVRPSNCVSRGYNHKPLQSLNKFCRFDGSLNPTSRRIWRTRDPVRNRSVNVTSSWIYKHFRLHIGGYWQVIDEAARWRIVNDSGDMAREITNYKFVDCETISVHCFLLSNFFYLRTSELWKIHYSGARFAGRVIELNFRAKKLTIAELKSLKHILINIINIIVKHRLQPCTRKNFSELCHYGFSQAYPSTFLSL